MAGALEVEQLVAPESGERTRSDLDGTWRNRLGSELTLQVTEDHALRGTFRLASPSGRHHDHPVRGFTEGAAFTFCVDFGEHGSVASWTGHLVVDDDEERLETLWLLSRSHAGEAGGSGSPAWGALLTGANTFTRRA